MPGESWRYGDMTTTPSGRIRRSETRRHCKCAERLSNLRAPRPARLPKPKPMIIKIKPADSRYERGTTGGQVIGCAGSDAYSLLEALRGGGPILHVQQNP